MNSSSGVYHKRSVGSSLDGGESLACILEPPALRKLFHALPNQVLQHVRLPLLNPKFLVGTVSTDLLIRSDEACRDLVDEAKNYLLLPQERPLMQGPRTRPRKPIRCGEVLFAGKVITLYLTLYLLSHGI